MTVSNGPILTVKRVSVDEISAQLLNEYVRGYLMNRDRLGIPLRQHLARHLTTMEQREVLAIDLNGIEEMTTSVAEEIGPKLFEEFLAHRGQGDEVYLVYCNVSEEIASGLEGAFRSWRSDLNPARRLTIVAFSNCQDGRFVAHRFIGEMVPDALREALDLIYSLGQASSSDLEAHGIKAASRKLNELYKQYPWLLQKSQKSVDAGPRAWAYFYSPPIVPAFAVQE